jgi:hypothetical protein
MIISIRGIAAAALLPLALAACGTPAATTSTTAPSDSSLPAVVATSPAGLSAAQVNQIAADIANGLGALHNVSDEIAAAAGADSATLTEIDAGIGAVQGAADALQQATSEDAQLSAVKAAEAGFDAVLAGAATLHLSGTAGQVIAALALVTPVLETGIDMVAAESALPRARALLARVAAGGKV